MDVVDPDLKTLCLERRFRRHEAIQPIAGCNNPTLAAQPLAFVAATADDLKDRPTGPLVFFYLHSAESLRRNLLAAELSDGITPRPLFLSHSDRATTAQSDCQNWIESFPAMLHQAGHLLTEHTDPECFLVTVSPMNRHGHFRPGTNVDCGASVIRKAKRSLLKSIVTPRALGECSVRISGNKSLGGT